MSTECKTKSTNKTNLSKHKKELEKNNIDQSKNEKISALEKELEKTKADAESLRKELEQTKKQLKIANEKYEKSNDMLISTLESQREFLKQTNRSSILAIDKAVDAMSYIATHQKKESKVRQIKYESAELY